MQNIMEKEQIYIIHVQINYFGNKDIIILKNLIKVLKWIMNHGILSLRKK